MTWWFMLLIAGAILAGILAGTQASKIFLGRQEKDPRFRSKRGLLEGKDKQTAPVGIVNNSQEPINEQQEHDTKAEQYRSPLSFHKKTNDYSEEGKREVPYPKPDTSCKEGVLTELEYNLAIADKPLNGKLNVFQTAMWDSQRSEFDVLAPDIKWQLTQIYTDMFLANNIVNVSNKIGMENKALSLNYLEMRTKIAERLQQILPAVKAALE